MIRRAALAAVFVLFVTSIYGEIAIRTRKAPKEPPRATLRARAIGKNGQPKSIGFAGDQLRLTVNVPPKAENRMLATGVECENYSRSWQEQLNGEAAQYSRESNIGPMPPGWCQVGTTVAYLDPSAKQGFGYFTALAEICYIGGDTSCQ